MTKQCLKRYGWVFLIAIIAILFRCFYFADKDRLFLDESLTVVISNYTTLGWSDIIQDDSTVFEGQEIVAQFLGDDQSPKELLVDMYNLHRNSRDIHHSNLFYTLYRISTFQVAPGDVDAYILRGFLLNLIFFVIGFFFLYKLAKLLFKDNPLLVAFFLALASLNPLAVSNTIYIRCYQLQEMLIIILVYIVIWLVVNRAFNKATYSQMIVGALIISFCALSGYFVLGLIALLSAFVCIMMYIRGDETLVRQIFIVLSLSFIITLALYPPYLSPILNTEAAGIFSKLDASSFISNLMLSVEGLISILSSSTIGIVGAVSVLVLVALYVQNREKPKDTICFLPLILAIIALLWSLLTLYTANYKVGRYIVSAIPIFLLAIPWFVSSLRRNVIKRIFMLLIVASTIVNYATATDRYWELGPIDESYMEDENVPLLITGIDIPVTQIALYPFYTKGRIVEFVFNEDDFIHKIDKYNEVYVIVDTSKDSLFHIPQSHIIESVLAPAPSYSVGYKVVRK